MSAPRNLNPQSSVLNSHSVRVRIAPSPTGPFHIGTARTALFNWLFARKHGGKFILRIEDTDRDRSEIKYEKEIEGGLRWLGFDWSEHYKQSERGAIYKKYLERLLAEKKAYWCYCTKEELEAARQAMTAQGLPPKYSGHCRKYADQGGTGPSASPGEYAELRGREPQVVRFKTPEAIVEFKDIIRGKMKFDASLFGDMVIAKNLDSPLYNFAAVVDDHEMRITHVIRGEDHLSNTPKQILLQKALELNRPEYAHLPLILGQSKQKLSKRFAEVSFMEYKDDGYLREAMVNFLALLGWHPKEDREVLTVEELINEFDLKRVQKAGAVFNLEKLDWLQKEHMKKLSADELIERVKPFLNKESKNAPAGTLRRIMETERTRIKTLSDFTKLTGLFFKLPDYDPQLLIWQKESAERIKEVLESAFSEIKKTNDKNFNQKNLSAALEKLCRKEGRGAVLWPLRVALSGQKASPDPLGILEILGKPESERRIKIALNKLARLLV